VRRDDHRIDLDEVRRLAHEHKPRLLFCGGTAYPRTWDFPAFADIAKETGAVLVADIAHIAGLVAGGAHPSPVGHADVITSTTHKTLRGPRGGMILTGARTPRPSTRRCSRGSRAGPHVAQIAALAVAAKEAATEDFKRYAHQVVANAKALAAALTARGYALVSGGTDNHLLLVDLTSKGIAGKKPRRPSTARGSSSTTTPSPTTRGSPSTPRACASARPPSPRGASTRPTWTRSPRWFDEAVKAAEDDDAPSTPSRPR
jgi:glycine hydroxymethyltransferase